MLGGGGRRALVGALAAVLGLVAASAAVPAASQSAASGVRIVFTGQGGGRYLDVTRWLHEDTRECYARQTEDQMVHVVWRITFTARVVRHGDDWQVLGMNRKAASVTGSVDGKSVRDSCDAADEEPGWGGTSACAGALPIRSRGALRARAAARLHLVGPSYGSLGGLCETGIRNDQLQAHVATGDSLDRALQTRRAVTLRVGTKHPGPGDAYVPTQFCSAFPHIYEGVVYFYDCQDTLTWSGTVSIAPV